jgi:tRNA pseudouridine38-40 synthase
MNESASQLLGEHDFFAFCKFRQGASTVKNLIEFSWSRNKDGVVIGQITADSFGYNMVRNLVGAAVCVGEGRFDSAWVKKVLDEKVRISDSYVFPAKGLTLISINYPPENQYLDRYNRFQDWQDLDAVEG